MAGNSENKTTAVKAADRHGSIRAESTLLTTFSILLFVILSLLIL